MIGQRIERREIGAPDEFEALADDELERTLRERFLRHIQSHASHGYAYLAAAHGPPLT